MQSIIWRIGAGNEDKDLVPLMLEKQVMLIGPGNDTGDITGKDLNTFLKLTRTDRSSLRSFRDEAKEGNLVVLRLGSVCFSVGAISSGYIYDDEYSDVYSYWNDNKAKSGEQPWDLQHTRKVKWYVLSDRSAIYHFRKGIYGGAQRFCRLGDTGKDICVKAKEELDRYLISIGYDNNNGEQVLQQIGKPCNKVNAYGFPTYP
jgi:hypothetical protein